MNPGTWNRAGRFLQNILATTQHAGPQILDLVYVICIDAEEATVVGVKDCLHFAKVVGVEGPAASSEELQDLQTHIDALLHSNHAGGE